MSRDLFMVCGLIVVSCGPPGPGGNLEGDAVETCDNGWDDDRDGMVDEDCGCTLGATQACWPGEAGERGVGECRDGWQMCEGVNEFTRWGPCQGSSMPSNDEFGDGLDQDCSGEDGAQVCSTQELGCNDLIDDDCDEAIDCDDPDCAAEPFCCERCEPGATRWCDTPTACTWGQQTCNPDGNWGGCVEAGTPEACRDPGETTFGVPSYYNTECCLSLPDTCCQNFPGYDSVGECAGVAGC